MAARFVLLAGYRRSLAATILLDRLARTEGTQVVAVICVNEYSLRRILAWRKRFGPQLFQKIASVLGAGGGTAFDTEREVLIARLVRQRGKVMHLPGLSKELGVPFKTVKGINTPDALDLVRRLKPDFAIYAGGGILKKRLLEWIPGGVLNIHSGPLPHVKGMSGPEWSLFLGLRPTATVHFIDPGIDTGAILGERTLEIERGEDLGRVRGRTLLEGIDLLGSLLESVVSGTAKRSENPPGRGRQYHEMARPLKRIVQDWVDSGITPIASHRELDSEDLTPAGGGHPRHGSND